MPKAKAIRSFLSKHMSFASIQYYERTVAQVRAAPLPFVLLAFNWGGYFLAALIALFAGGGISESEEWRIFVVGWPTIPLLALTAALLMAEIKRVYYADIEAFYPLLLSANALFWVAYFAYHFPPPWLYKYDVTPQSLRPLVWLMPLVNALALVGLNLCRSLLAKRDLTRLYALLPIAALYVGVNFSGFQISDPGLLRIPWPVIKAHDAETSTTQYRVTEGVEVWSTEGYPLNTRITAKISGILQADLPWHMLSDAKATAWHAKEGEWIEPNQVLIEFESEYLHTEVIARIPILLKKKEYIVGEEAEPRRALGLYYTLTDAIRFDKKILYTALILALASLLSGRLKMLSSLSPPAIAIDGAILLSTALLVIDLGYLYEVHHYNFYLGPINDVLHGKTLLVDINCQYGVGVVYFLAVIFKLFPIPFNYQGFSLLLSILLVAQYALFYLLMRRVLHSQFFSAAALVLIVAANYYSQLGATYPSTGPLRFGLAYVLLALLVARNHSDRQRWLLIAIYATVGLSSLWSFEAFTYTIATYFCSELYTLIWNPRELNHKLHRLFPLLGGPAIAVSTSHLALALFTYFRAGAWPEWSHYFDYIALYSVGEFGTLTVDAWRPWALYIAVYFLSLLLLLYKALFAPSKDAAPFAFIAGLTGFGIVQFTYFLGRSHHNNLYHICIPLIVIATYWFLFMQRSSRQTPRGFAQAITYCFCAIAFVLLVKTGPDFAAKWPRSPLHQLMELSATTPSPWSAGPSHGEVRDALTLIGRRAADDERIALFLPPELTTETLMLSKKTHVFPLSNPRQDELLPAAIERAQHFDHGLKEGDYFFITRNIGSLNIAQEKVIEEILSQLHGVHVDSTEYVQTIRLITPRPTNPQ
jgi:hypothetical protein